MPESKSVEVKPIVMALELTVWLIEGVVGAVTSTVIDLFALDSVELPAVHWAYHSDFASEKVACRVLAVVFERVALAFWLNEPVSFA